MAVTTTQRWTQHRRLLPVAAVSLLVAACATTPRQTALEPQDGPPAVALKGDAMIHDAVPRLEPRSKYGNPAFYYVGANRYETLASSKGYTATGKASWYGTKFHGKRTSSGEPYDLYAMTAAHRTLPLPTYVEVTNLDNGRKAIVKVNDRGPFHADRIIDLSYAAAHKLGVTRSGTANVEIRAIDPLTYEAPSTPPEPPILAAGSTPAPIEATPLPDAAPAKYLQVGAFTSRRNAENLRARLEGKTPAPVIIRELSQTNPAPYRVRLGPLASNDDVQLATTRLAELGYTRIKVVLD